MICSSKLNAHHDLDEREPVNPKETTTEELDGGFAVGKAVGNQEQVNVAADKIRLEDGSSVKSFVSSCHINLRDNWAENVSSLW
jgi:hypothetical protein